MRASSISKSLLTAAAAIFAVAAVPAQAQISTTANGPYYATPSWDQKLTTNRFVILANWNNEAVLDRETGVVWQRSPITYATELPIGAWYCHLANTGGRRGWRLPRAEELSSLLEPDPVTGMATLPANHPFVGIHTSSQGFYWSATRSLVPNSTQMWVVSFYNGAGGAYSTSSHYLWCARGGQGADAQ
jgi:hypothetical protein